MRFSRKTFLGACAGLFCISGMATSAWASSITFDFDSPGLSNGATSTDIGNYMNSILQGAGFGAVTVTGGIAQQGRYSYAGEGYVVGPKIRSGRHRKVYPLTLANTNGSSTPNNDSDKWRADPPSLSNSNPDGFIKNCTGVDSRGSCPGGNSDGIYMTFTPLGLLIDSISFDLQIFPDGSCPSFSHCGSHQSNWPDFKLYVNDRSGSSSPIETWLGVVPGTDGTYQHSINHKSSDETAPQLLTTAMIDLGGIDLTTLDFVDWPATIGIDNLTISYHQLPPLPPQRNVPAPATLILFVAGLGGLGFVRRRRRHAA